MKSIKQLAAKATLGLAAFGGVLAVMAAPGAAKADPYIYHYYGPSVYVPRVYVPRVYVPRVVVSRYVAPEIHVRTYAPEIDRWAPGGAVLIRGGFHFDAPYAPVGPVVLPW